MAAAYPSFGFDPATRRRPFADFPTPQGLAPQQAVTPQPVQTPAAPVNPAQPPVPSGPAVNPGIPTPRPNVNALTATAPLPPGPGEAATGNPGLPPPHADLSITAPNVRAIPVPGHQDPNVPLEQRSYLPAPGNRPYILPPGPLGSVIDAQGLDESDKEALELQVRQATGPGIKISRTSAGDISQGPDTKPSRLKQFLIGMGQGALAGGANGGGLGGVIGGAITGGIIGGVSPRTMQALNRQQDIDHLRGQIAQNQELELKSAEIGHVYAQTAENAAQARYYGSAQRRGLQGPKTYKEGGDGKVYEISDEYPEGRPVSNIPAAADPTRRYFDQGPAGIWYTDKAHPQGAKLEDVPGQAASGAASGVAAQGTREAELAQKELDGLQTEYDGYAKQLKENEDWLQKRKDAWHAQMNTPEWQEKLKNMLAPGGAEKLNMVDVDGEKIPQEILMADPIYSSGTYETTLNETKQKRDYIVKTTPRLDKLKSDVRTGLGQAARGGITGTAAPGTNGAAATHAFSITHYMQQNPGTNDNDARQYAAQHYPGFTIKD